MTIDLTRLRQTYFEESFEGLDAMEAGLLELEVGDPDPEVVNAIFRAAHSIKGGGGTFGFDQVTSFTHVLETLLDEMRDGRRQVDERAVTALLESVDTLRSLMEALQADEEPDVVRVASTLASLEAIRGEASDRNDASVPGAHEPAPTPQVGSGWIVDFRPHPDLLRTANDPVLMFRELRSLTTVDVVADLSGLAAWSDLDPEASYLSWRLELGGGVPRDAVTDVFAWVDGQCDLVVEPRRDDSDLFERSVDTIAGAVADGVGALAAAETSSPADDEASTAANGSARSGGEERRPGEERRQGGDRRRSAAKVAEGSIRVGTEKIDALINMVGELVITQAMLGQISTDFSMERIEDLKNGLNQLAHHTRELQESVMRIRMLPISHVFSRLPRIVHDTSQKLGKRIDLQITGESTELDKTVLEKIGDPLVHLVRNAIDHGIESIDDRLAAGKPDQGRVTLHAFHQGGNVMIEIGDDGRGLDHEKILAKARAQGLVDVNVRPSDEEIAQLIFHPGLSTADKVSDVSGRGVGMDVVRGNITALGGNVSVHSEKGRGTTITIRLPLTLAILDGQLVRVGSQVFVIPLVSIIESLQIRRDRVNEIAGRAEIYRLRDENIPIVRLYRLLGVEPDSTELDRALMVVVDGDGAPAGFLVDELMAQQQVVIKSLESNYRKVPGISGATILGDGTVALILDAADIVQLSRSQALRRDDATGREATARS